MYGKRRHHRRHRYVALTREITSWRNSISIARSCIIVYTSLISSLPGQSPLEHFLVSWWFPSHSRLSSFCPVLGKTQVPVLLCFPPPHETEQSVHGDQRHWPPDKTNIKTWISSACVYSLCEFIRKTGEQSMQPIFWELTLFLTLLST